MKLFKLIILFLFFAKSSAQPAMLTLLKGKGILRSEGFGDVNVANLRSESATTTDGNGDFSLFVKEGDTLRFTGLQVVTKEVVISQHDLDKQIFVVNLEQKVNQLEEVEIVQNKNINAVSMGILQKPAKKYTPAERKLKTAGDFKPIQLLGILGGQLPIDPIINKISGRTSMLKKELAVEKKEFLLQKIEDQFGYAFFTEELKIPVDYVRGFWYYAIEDPEFVGALNAKKKALSKFILGELSAKYLEVIAQK